MTELYLSAYLSMSGQDTTGNISKKSETCLRRTGSHGIALIHTIGRADGPSAANPWINKYIFPGGYIPALFEILPAIEEAGLYLTDIEVLRLHYAETVKAWRQRFNVNRRHVAEIYDERVCRMCDFYLAGCEAGFRHGGLVNFQSLVTTRIDTFPLVRDYITEFERDRLDGATPK